MNSGTNFMSATLSDPKIKIMAHQYKRFCIKTKNQTSSKYKSCLTKSIYQLYHKSQKIWNSLMPVFLRGSVTPLEQFKRRLKVTQNTYQRQLPFSKKNILQNIEEGNSTIVFLYCGEKMSETIEFIKESSCIENLLKSNFTLCPVGISDTEYESHYKGKVQQILTAKQKNQEELYFMILWKGLFNEIVILDLIEAKSECAYLDILRKIDEREEYEAEVKRLADIGNMSVEYQTNQQLQQKIAITRSSSVSQL